MKRLLCIFCLLAAAAAQDGAAGPTWFRFESKDHGFRVSVPAEPEKTVLSEEAGAWLVSYVSRSGGQVFVVTALQTLDDGTSRKNLPKTPEEVERYFDRSRNGFLQSLGERAKLDEEKSLTVHGLPARWLRGRTQIESQKLTVEAEFVLFGRRIYSLNALAPEGRDPADFRKFLNSFEVIEAAKSAAPGQEWPKFTSEDGRFSVSMPDKPKEVERAPLQFNNVTVDRHSVRTKTPNGSLFGVSYLDARTSGNNPATLTAEDADRVFKSLRKTLIDGMTDGDESRITYAQEITVNGFPVQQYKCRTKWDIEVDVRYYFVNGRLYMVDVVHERGQQDEKETKKFFDSFEFTPTTQ